MAPKTPRHQAGNAPDITPSGTSFYVVGSMLFFLGSTLLLFQARTSVQALPSLIFMAGSGLFLGGTLVNTRRTRISR